jgi:hypothetical protein
MCEKIYALLLRLFPSHFLDTYGDEALQLFRDRARHEKGFFAGLRLWLDLLGDLARSVPREYSHLQHNFVSAVARQPSRDVPSFRVIETELPRPGSLLFGSVLTLLAVFILPVLFNQIDDRPQRAAVIKPQAPANSPAAPSQGAAPQVLDDTKDDIREDIKDLRRDTGDTKQEAAESEGAAGPSSTVRSAEVRPLDSKPDALPKPETSRTSQPQTSPTNSQDAGRTAGPPGASRPNALPTSGISRNSQLQAPQPDVQVAAGKVGVTAPCTPVPGADQIWSNPSLRWVLIGEVYGDKETPAAFLNLVCDALSRGRKVVVALEHPSDEQAALDGILTAPALEPAQTILLSQPSWRNGMDGRASEAMLDLILSLRDLHQAHPGLSVAAFDVPLAGATTVAEREQGMGRTLLALASAKPDHLILVLTGNLHAVEEPRFGHDMAAMYLPAKKRLSLEVTYRGGQAWWRSPDGCGPMKATASGRELTPYGIFLKPALAPDGKYDGILSLSTALTPSSPAAGIPFPLPLCRVKFLAQQQRAPKH